MVFSDSFASLFLIQEQLISSGVIILSSLLTIIHPCIYSVCSDLRFLGINLHMPISFRRLFFAYWFWFGKRKPWRDGCRSDPVFSGARRKESLTPQAIWSTPELNSKLARATWNLGICYKFCDIRWWIQPRSSLLINFRWKELLVQLLCARGGTRRQWSAGC